MVGPTEDIAGFFASDLGHRARVIHNPVLGPAIRRAPSEAAMEHPGRTLVAMGRLVDEKGFPLLIRAFAQLAAKHPSWSLEIWGIGPLRPALERLARNLGLNGQVRLPGFTLHPARRLARGDLSPCPRSPKGSPTRSARQWRAGLPVVSFNCSSGIPRSFAMASTV